MSSSARSRTPTTRPDSVDADAERTWRTAGFVLVRSEPDERKRRVSHVDRGAPAPWPTFVLVEVSELEAMAYRYDRTAGDAGDTWHPDEVEAWAYLEWEYEGLVSQRFELPAGANVDDFVLDAAHRHIWT